MADVTNELILEHLKRIHAKLLDHDGRFDVIDRRLGHLEMSFAGMQQQLGQLAETDAHLQV